ncbi:alkylated DNA repair protein [Trypanosoma grayi]|uniref:alkylated DNA repair protein n=1 Tax=Trypanosoma grayi TaxID=71804 RepID=UPI0004F4209E|nr:alkylated DNA repair protein [Trypanosoma grayi]KEG08002.1 alkylated DNA repair protein [Trypanosoma grayi]
MEVVPPEGQAIPQQCTSDGDLALSAFRCAEKRYKLYRYDRRTARRTHVPETDFSDVVDFHCLETNTEKNRSLIGVLDGFDDAHVKCFTFAGVPGLLVFSQAISETDQQELCRDALLEYGDSQRHPNHLSTHASKPRSTTRYEPPMRWATLGFSYNWTLKSYCKERYSPFPQRLRKHIKRIVSLLSKTPLLKANDPLVFEPQTSIVNYYPVGSMLMAHQDVSEELIQQPLISISLGCSCVFLMGTPSRDDAPYAFWLRSGDVAVFCGPSRTAFHSVPRIMDDCPPHLCTLTGDISGDQDEGEAYWREQMRHMRLNINVRQVFADSCGFLFE